MELSQLADRVETLLHSYRYDDYEIMVGKSNSLSIEVKEGDVDSFKASEPVGVGLRLLRDNSMGFSFSTSFAPADLTAMIQNAAVSAGAQTPDSCCNLPTAPDRYPFLQGMIDTELSAISKRDKVARALALEQLCLSQDKRLKRVRKATYSDSTFAVHLRTSTGIDAGYAGTSVSSSVAVLAEDHGDSQLGWDFAFSPRYDGIDITALATGAAHKAVRLLGARKIETLNCPVILDNHAVTEILEVLASSFLAENVKKGKSLLVDKCGSFIASPLVTVIDDGLRFEGAATSPFDGEGVPHQSTCLIRDGILQGYLYDSFWGRKSGYPSTGNGVRNGVKGLPHLGITNLFLENGTTEPGEMLRGIQRGVLLVNLMGMHTANPISGDFSVGASGFLIEQGEITLPVKEIVLSGNLLDLLNKVESVGNDLRFFGSVGAPSLRVSELAVSGS